MRSSTSIYGTRRDRAICAAHHPGFQGNPGIIALKCSNCVYTHAAQPLHKKNA